MHPDELWASVVVSNNQLLGLCQMMECYDDSVATRL
jgi:hypothetical protein